MSQKIPKIFLCETCDYNTSNKKDFNKHLSTDKHKTEENNTILIPKIPKNPQKSEDFKVYECFCGKRYKHRQNLYAHRKKCMNIEHNKIKLNDGTDDINYKDMFIKMLQENSEMKNIIIEQNKHIGELIPKVGNNNNNTINNHFNLNFFLNEQCKEAITMDEFINKMNISLTNLFYTKKKGIAEGISNIFIENLNKLPLNQRPIHCTDVKRETIYIKNEQWEKDENKTQTKDAIKKVSYLQIKNIKLFKESKPNLMENQKDKEDYMELIKATTDSIENKQDKVIKNICKNIYIKNDLLE